MRIGFMKKVLILIFLMFFTHPVFAYMTDDYFLNRKFDELERKINDIELQQIQSEILNNNYQPKFQNSGTVKLDFSKNNKENPIYSQYNSVSENFKEDEMPKSQYEIAVENEPLQFSDNTIQQNTPKFNTLELFLITCFTAIIIFIFCIILKFKILKTKK